MDSDFRIEPTGSDAREPDTLRTRTSGMVRRRERNSPGGRRLPVGWGIAGGIAIVLAVAFVGCTPAATIAGSDVVGTWTLDEGGTAVFGEDSVRFDDFYVSPISVGVTDVGFTGTGTWELTGKSSIDFVLTEYTSLGASSSGGAGSGARLKAVVRYGEVQLSFFDSGREISYYLKKERKG